jgi:hypothetical protein
VACGPQICNTADPLVMKPRYFKRPPSSYEAVIWLPWVSGLSRRWNWRPRFCRFLHARLSTREGLSRYQVQFDPEKKDPGQVLAEFPTVTVFVVLVGFAVLFIPGLFMGSIAIRLILAQAAQADPNRLVLGLYLERSLVGFEDFAH